MTLGLLIIVFSLTALDSEGANLHVASAALQSEGLKRSPISWESPTQTFQSGSITDWSLMVSGQVTGFLDNYDPLDQSRIAEISNKVGGTEQRVLFSRGIPDVNAWN